MMKSLFAHAATILLLTLTTRAFPLYAADPAAAIAPPKNTPWTVEVNEEWKVADQADLEVGAGTALDLSAVFPVVAEAGADGFAMVNDKGELVFSKKPNSPVRFRAASSLPTRGMVPILEMLSAEEADRFADQLARGGYNACRPHFLDLALMHGSTEDLVMNPERLDRWDYFASALKKRGVYLYIDATTSASSFYAVKDPWSKEANQKNLSVRLYYDETARAHWKEAVKRFFEHVNPYTGVALKDEPQVMVVQLRNEAGLNFKCYFKNGIPPGLLDAFRGWLKKKYETKEKLKAAWTKKEGDATTCYLRSGRTFETLELPQFDGRGPDSADLQLFFTDTERETTAWMIKAIREIGVKVPLIDYNNGTSLQTAFSRDMLELTDGHCYHDHPTSYITPGSTIVENSSTAVGLNYYHTVAATRQLGRPFFCSEWGHVFWNRWRHEAGLTFPAYASLQGWQFLTHFAHPIQLRSRSGIVSFNIHNDPPLRAAEYMSALFFRRGDVQTSSHTIEMKLDPNALPENLSQQDALSASISRLAMLSKFGVNVVGMPNSGKRAPYQADLILTPEVGDKVLTRDGVQEVVGNENANKSGLMDCVAQLRSKSVLSKENRTDVGQGIYESDTGQILLEEKKRQIRVVTPRSFGISLLQGSPETTIGSAVVRNLGIEATFFVGSLTEQPATESNRLLLILSTNALNSGMTFENEKRLKLVSLGKAPILMHVAKAQFTLNHKQASKLKMWALSYSGLRREEIPLTVRSDSVSGEIDTAKLANGPTPYFELAVVNTP